MSFYLRRYQETKLCKIVHHTLSFSALFPNSYDDVLQVIPMAVTSQRN